jgi:hypothetical protein
LSEEKAGRRTMAALIGLFVGALVGASLWHEWGAALGGIAGFFAGAKLASMRRAKSATAAATGHVPATRKEVPPFAPAGRAADANAELVRRIVELERRVATLERAASDAGLPIAGGSAPGPATSAVTVPETIAVPPLAAPEPRSPHIPVDAPPTMQGRSRCPSHHRRSSHHRRRRATKDASCRRLRARVLCGAGSSEATR